MASSAVEMSWMAVTMMTGDRKSTRLNSSHLVISYAVFCLKKKKKKISCLFVLMPVRVYLMFQPFVVGSLLALTASQQYVYHFTRRVSFWLLCSIFAFIRT